MARKYSRINKNMHEVKRLKALGYDRIALYNGKLVGQKKDKNAEQR